MPNKRKGITPFLMVFLILFTSPFIHSQKNSYLLDKEILEAIENEVSGERAWDMVAKITRFHRIRGGGEGSDYNRCVDFLAKELKKIGLEEVKVIRYRANGFQKYFLWRSVVGWRVKEAELWLLEPYKKLLARYSDQAVSLMPYSQGGEAEGELVYVGEGKSDKDYEDKEVKGKLVFATGGDGPEVHRQAVLERGALGVIVGPSDREDRLQFPDLIEVNRLSPKGEDVEKTGFGFALSRRQEKEILSLFREGKKVIMKAKVEAELFDGEMPVLEGKVTGRQYPSQEIIVMGHLDHYKPGANDNASGSAGMVEMARNILALVKRGAISTPKRTIRFLWLPEIHGTAAYFTEHLDLKDKGIAGLNLDMIGENYHLCESYFSLVQSPYSVPGYINDVLLNLTDWLDSLAFYSPRGSRLRFNFRLDPFWGGSDHIMFNDSALSIPTPMLIHRDVFHHTNLDTPDKCDPTELKRIISLSLAAAIFIANAGEEEALKIAREVHSKAALRMTERTRKSLLLLQQYAEKPKMRKSLAELHSNILNYPQIQANIESANLKEIKELCQEELVKSFIDNLTESLKVQAAQERKNIDAAHGLLCRLYNIKKETFQPTEWYLKASSLRPKRLFKGPLPWTHAQENLSQEDFEHYQKNVEKIGGRFDSSLYEIINLMDGKRTILDIRHIVSCEYDETEVEFILQFVEDLKKMGLVEY